MSIGLQLIERGAQCGGFRTGLLHLDHADRQTVQEHHHIRAAVVAVLDHRELRDGQPVVLPVLRVDQARGAAADRAILGTVFHPHAFDHRPVQPAAFFDQRGALDRQQLAQGILAGVLRDLRVQPGHRRAQTAGPGIIDAGIAQCGKVTEQDGFNFGFGEWPSKHPFREIGHLGHPQFARHQAGEEKVAGLGEGAGFFFVLSDPLKDGFCQRIERYQDGSIRDHDR